MALETRKRLNHDQPPHSKSPRPKIASRRMAWRLGLLALFVLFLRWGYLPTRDGLGIYIWETYGRNFLQEGRISLLLIVPALASTILLSLAFMLFYYAVEKIVTRWGQGPLARLSRVLILKSLAAIPPLLAALPLFVTGIYLLHLFHVDTVNLDSCIHPYGILTLALFNFNDCYRRANLKIRLAYQAPPVLFARSLGIPAATIFRCYVLPMAIRDHLAIVRELLPHLMAESIVIEYVFAFSALGRSLLAAIRYHNWPYCMIVMVAFFLFIELCDELFRLVAPRPSP